MSRPVLALVGLLLVGALAGAAAKWAPRLPATATAKVAMAKGTTTVRYTGSVRLADLGLPALPGLKLLDGCRYEALDQQGRLICRYVKANLLAAGRPADLAKRLQAATHAELARQGAAVTLWWGRNRQAATCRLTPAAGGRTALALEQARREQPTPAFPHEP